jgi:hypothetical protein
MSRLRFTVPLLVVGMLSSGFLLGDDKKEANRDPIVVKASLPRNYAKLGLNEKQKKEIYKIRAVYAGKIEELNRQLKALKDKEKTELDGVLTTAQKARLRELQQGGTTAENEPVAKPPTEAKKK